MKTIVYKVRTRFAPAKIIKEAVRSLKDGGVVVFPTDTVYGLAADAFQPGAISRIYRLKGRFCKKPLPYLSATFAQARALVEPVSGSLKKLLDDYWPGPLTVVFKASPLGRWVTGGKETIAVRIPKHPVALDILRETGAPLAVTSANASGKNPAVNGAEAVKIFRGKVSLLIDAGRCPGGEASTVLDASGFPWTLVREGAIKKTELLKYLF